MNALQKLDRTIPILSEESLVEWNERKNWTKYWLVDPLDGTANYARGLPLCCVSIALMSKTDPLLGVVYDFNNKDLYEGHTNGDAKLNNSNYNLRNNGGYQQNYGIPDFKMSHSKFINF